MSFKNCIYKKVIAAATALTMVFTAAGCGESTSWIAKYNDQTVNAGVYIYYQTQAMSEATSKLKKINADLDLTDTKLVKTLTLENVDVTTWVNNKAQEQVKLFIAVNQKFDELGFSLTDEEKSEIEQMFEYYWEYSSAEFEKNGIGKDSFRELVELEKKKNKLFEHYYGEGGEKEVSDAEINAFLEGNYSRVKMIKLHLTDGKDEDLDDAGKKKIKEMAEDYKKRAIAGENFDDLIDEYNEYREKLVAEANPSEETETDETAETTVAENEESTEETTVAEGEENTEETTAAEGEENTEETTAAEDEENAEETTAAEDEENTEETEEEDPYANENIYKIGSEEDGYFPSEKINEAIFSEVVVNGDPYIIEDSDAKYIYVIQRLDILQRTDMYEGDQRINVLWEMFEEDFKTTAIGWLSAESLKLNDGSIKRYDPFNIKVN
ncbi:MAG: hypothetical protein PUE12_13375 [Oscillospiraceae bacterium]|nr:hypothetical protein [Oscillospiraceae bacterium]